jgi:hypothetical protein
VSGKPLAETKRALPEVVLVLSLANKTQKAAPSWRAYGRQWHRSSGFRPVMDRGLEKDLSVREGFRAFAMDAISGISGARERKKVLKEEATASGQRDAERILVLTGQHGVVRSAAFSEMPPGKECAWSR